MGILVNGVEQFQERDPHLEQEALVQDLLPIDVAIVRVDGRIPQVLDGPQHRRIQVPHPPRSLVIGMLLLDSLDVLVQRGLPVALIEEDLLERTAVHRRRGTLRADQLATVSLFQVVADGLWRARCG